MNTDPFGLDRIRLEQASLRRRVARSPQRPARSIRRAEALSTQGTSAPGFFRPRLAFAGGFLHRSRSHAGCMDG